MLSLSWSPFLLVSAVTVLLFVLFASVTFAMIKYADLAGILLQTDRNERSIPNGGSTVAASNYASSSGASSSSTTTTSHRSGRKETEFTTPTTNDDDCSISGMENNNNPNNNTNLRRARVIAIDTAPNSTRLSATDKGRLAKRRAPRP